MENPNEVSPEVAGIHSLNSFITNNAAARGVMMAGHFAQRPVIIGSEPPLIISGPEDEMGKYTFSISMPEDGRILKIIPRYRHTLAEDRIDVKYSDVLVIYQAAETGEVDYFMLPYYRTNGTSFGFKYEPKPALDRLAPDVDFQKGEVFMDTPANSGKSFYTFGCNLNMAVMSHQFSGLDGYVISRDVIDKFSFHLYETRSVDFGATEFPLNIYGDDDNYQAFPELGQLIKPSGLLMAFRQDSPALSPALLSRKDLQVVNHAFDRCVYSRAGEGRVVGVDVIHTNNVNRQLPAEMTKPLWKYVRANQDFHQQIVDFETKYLRDLWKYDKNAKMPCSTGLQRLLVESKAYVNHPVSDINSRGKSLTLLHRKERLDSWRITFTIEYLVKVERGFKITDLNGGKGVLCSIEEPENMPIDADGNRADILSSTDSIPGRMNLGRLYAPYFTGASRDITKQMLEEFGLDRQFKGPLTDEMIEAIPADRLEKGLATLTHFYSIVSKTMYDEFTTALTPQERAEWLKMLVNEKPYLHIPVNTEKQFDEMVLEIERDFKLVYGPVSYVGVDGERVTTEDNIRIAPIYIMALDKIADKWISTDIGSLSHFGILSGHNRASKYSKPWKKSSPRNIGEAEAHIHASYGGRWMTAELMDRSASIHSQGLIARKILHADQPTNINNLIDRSIHPYGMSRNIQFIQHHLRPAGAELTYVPEEI